MITLLRVLSLVYIFLAGWDLATSEWASASFLLGLGLLVGLIAYAAERSKRKM